MQILNYDFVRSQADMTKSIECKMQNGLRLFQSVAEFVGQRAEPLRLDDIGAFSVLTHFVGLAHLLNSRHAEANATRRRIDVVNDDLEPIADAKRFLHVYIAGYAALAQRDKPFHAWLEFDERPELGN